MTKGGAALSFRFDAADDKQQVPPLRYAPVGMTKGRTVLPFGFVTADGEQQVPPLRYAPVGMTLLFGNARSGFQDEVSSRPERSGVERSAVAFSGSGEKNILDATL
jgi:hypothetical protein